MKYVYYTFRSVTSAMEGKRILDRSGIGASLIRTPEALRSRGCGYSLRIRGIYLYEGRKLLEENGIQPEKMFQEDASGQWREVVP